MLAACPCPASGTGAGARPGWVGRARVWRVSSEIPDLVEARPWRPGDGPPPKVRTWPPGEQPALWVWLRGKWQYAPVTARQDWADGRVVYQVEVEAEHATEVSARRYQWPQPGLRAAREPRQQ